MPSIDTWRFLAGLGLFLYGITLMEQSTRQVAGRAFKLFLRDHTNNLYKAIVNGTLITGLIQSSSVVIVMLMSFVEAGVLSFRNALGVLIGSNLGTTVDSWFYAGIGFTFNLQAYSLPLIAAVAISMFFTQKREQLYHALSFIFSIGILLLGFGFMKEGAEQMVARFDMAAYAHYNLFLVLCAGFILTVIIQSSSATVVIALTALHAHALSFPAAACLIIGSELGTTIKFLLSSLQGSPEKKMLAWSDFIFNAGTVLLAFAGLHWIIYLVQEIIQIQNPLIALVFFQSFINLLSILVVLPFINLLARWITRKFSKAQSNNGGLQLPDEAAPLEAVGRVQQAARDILRKVVDFHTKIYRGSGPAAGDGFLSKLRAFARVHGTTDQAYAQIKEAEGEVLEYYISLQKEEMERSGYERVQQGLDSIRQSIHAAKSVHDIRHNLESFHASANDFLFKQFAVLREEWTAFSPSLQALLDSPGGQELREAYTLQLQTWTDRFKAHTEAIEQSLGNNALNKMEASTLLNVYQESLSSKKALLRAVAMLKGEAGSDRS